MMEQEVAESLTPAVGGAIVEPSLDGLSLEEVTATAEDQEEHRIDYEINAHLKCDVKFSDELLGKPVTT